MPWYLYVYLLAVVTVASMGIIGSLTDREPLRAAGLALMLVLLVLLTAGYFSASLTLHPLVAAAATAVAAGLAVFDLIDDLRAGPESPEASRLAEVIVVLVFAPAIVFGVLQIF